MKYRKCSICGRRFWTRVKDWVRTESPVGVKCLTCRRKEKKQK